MTIAQIHFATDLLPNVDGITLLEVAGVLAGSCVLIRLSGKSNACRLLYTVTALYAAGAAARLLGFQLAGSVLYFGSLGAFVAMLILLQREIRDVLAAVEHWFLALVHAPQHHASG